MKRKQQFVGLHHKSAISNSSRGKLLWQNMKCTLWILSRTLFDRRFRNSNKLS